MKTPPLLLRGPRLSSLFLLQLRRPGNERGTRHQAFTYTSAARHILRFCTPETFAQGLPTALNSLSTLHTTHTHRHVHTKKKHRDIPCALETQYCVCRTNSKVVAMSAIDPTTTTSAMKLMVGRPVPVMRAAYTNHHR